MFETRAISEGAHSVKGAFAPQNLFETRAISEGAHSFFTIPPDYAGV